MDSLVPFDSRSQSPGQTRREQPDATGLHPRLRRSLEILNEIRANGKKVLHDSKNGIVHEVIGSVNLFSARLITWEQKSEKPRPATPEEIMQLLEGRDIVPKGLTYDEYLRDLPTATANNFLEQDRLYKKFLETGTPFKDSTGLINVRDSAGIHWRLRCDNQMVIVEMSVPQERILSSPSPV